MGASSPIITIATKKAATKRQNRNSLAFIRDNKLGYSLAQILLKINQNPVLIHVRMSATERRLTSFENFALENMESALY